METLSVNDFLDGYQPPSVIVCSHISLRRSAAQQVSEYVPEQSTGTRLKELGGKDC